MVSVPVIVGAGLSLTVTVMEAEPVGTPPVASTDTNWTEGSLQVTVMVLVPHPEVMVPPDDTVHVYVEVPGVAE